MKRFISTFLFCLFLVLPLNSADAADTLIYSNAATCSGWGPGTSPYTFRMSAATSATITAIEVPMSSLSGQSSVTLRILSEVASAPSAVLGTFTYDAASSTASLARFLGTANVSAGNFYWQYYATAGSSPCAGAYTNSVVSSWTASPYRFLSTYASGPFTYDSAGTGASALQLKIYIGAVDSTPPTFSSAEIFTVAENQTSVASIKVSESSTISIFGGQDQAKFSLAQSDSTSASLSFQTAPNFESPTDSGLDNTYQVVLKALDSAGNNGYETVTATVTDVDENARVVSYSVSGAQAKGSQITLVATVNFAGKVTFLANGKRIAGCISKSTVGTSPITATCNWKANLSGNIGITFKVVPTATNNFATTTAPIFLKINRRSSLR